MKFTMVMLEIRSGVPGFSGHYSEGVASIAAVVRQAGHDFELLHVTRPTKPEPLAERVRATSPDVVGFSCMTHTFPYLDRFVPAIKSVLPGVPTLLGGVHAILNPEQSIQIDGLDAVCLGEGEGVVLPLIERIEDGRPFHDIPGLLVRDGEKIHRNPSMPLITDLDGLPMPDRTVFDNARLVSTREGVIYVFGSRGCPYICPFCSNVAIRAQAPNPRQYLRYKSVQRVCQEIEAAVSNFPGTLRGIYFEDEILTLNTNWFREFADVYPERINRPFNCNLRADLVTTRVADLLQKAGCNSVSIGLESGVESIRSHLLGKNTPDEVFHLAFRRLRERGIGVNTFSMVGLPGETPEDALETLFFNADSEVGKPMISIFCPYPGTPLFDKAVADGILSGRMPDTYQDDTPLDQKTISSGQVRFLHDYFNELIFLLRSPWGGIRFRRAITRVVKSDTVLLRMASGVKRTIRYCVTAPYLWIGRYLYNRQSRVFKRCDPVTTGPIAPNRDA